METAPRRAIVGTMSRPTTRLASEPSTWRLDGQTPSVAAAADVDAAAAAVTLVRSVFFYNSHPPLGSTVGLHFFEPRYRILVQRALREPRRKSSFVFLPNYADYQCAHGDIGYLATIVAHRPVPTPNPEELPRADVQIRFDARVLVLFHWVEPSSGGLSECVCQPVAPGMLTVDEVPPLPEELSEAWLGFDWETHLRGPRVLRAALHGHPAGGHWLLHASTPAASSAALETVRQDFPLLAELLYPVLLPPEAALLWLSTLVRRLAALHIRLAAPPRLSAAASPFVPAANAAKAASAAAVDVTDDEVGGACARSAAACAAAAAACEAAVDAASSGLPVKELRARLQAMQVSRTELERCIEREDLVSLLQSKVRHKAPTAPVTAPAHHSASLESEPKCRAECRLSPNAPIGSKTLFDSQFSTRRVPDSLTTEAATPSAADDRGCYPECQVHRERRNLATAAAAELIVREVQGMSVPVVCGCPAGVLRVRGALP